MPTGVCGDIYPRNGNSLVINYTAIGIIIINILDVYSYEGLVISHIWHGNYGKIRET